MGFLNCVLVYKLIFNLWEGGFFKYLLGFRGYDRVFFVVFFELAVWVLVSFFIDEEGFEFVGG